MSWNNLTWSTLIEAKNNRFQSYSNQIRMGTSSTVHVEKMQWTEPNRTERTTHLSPHLIKAIGLSFNFCCTKIPIQFLVHSKVVAVFSQFPPSRRPHPSDSLNHVHVHLCLGPFLSWRRAFCSNWKAPRKSCCA